MTEFKIDKLGFYKTRGGEKVEVITTIRNNVRSVVYCTSTGDLWSVYPNGKRSDCYERNLDIISEWVEPAPLRTVTLKRWLMEEQCVDRDDNFFWITTYQSDTPLHGSVIREYDSIEVEV